ncbi:MAG: hypothetical protein ACYS80_19135 [Planctomycetota bacterium]
MPADTLAETLGLGQLESAWAEAHPTPRAAGGRIGQFLFGIWYCPVFRVVRVFRGSVVISVHPCSSVASELIMDDG